MQIHKWHVYLADLNPRRGTEPGKVRPVVVVQTDLLNGVHPSTVVCPLTTNVRPKARLIRVHLRAGEAGLTHPSDVMVDQLRAIDNRRFMQELGQLNLGSRRRLANNMRLLLS